MKTILKVCAWILAALLSPVIAWWIFNRIDEAPNAKYLEYTQPLPRGLPDARNAWLFMAGFDAAEGDDPVVLGRRRVDGYTARVTKSPVPKETAADTALFRPVVDFAGPPAGQALCEDRAQDCVAWAGENRQLLDQLERDNALLLRRHAALLAMRELQEVGTPSNVDPSPLPNLPGRIDALYANLAARDVALGKDPAAAVARLAHATRFWRFAETQAATLHLKLTAIRMIERYQRVLGAIVDRATTAQLAALQPHADVVLAEPVPGQRDFRPMWTRWEYQIALHTLRSAFPSTSVHLTRCLDGEEQDCIKTLLMRQGYVPQASANRLAQIWADAEPVLNAEAREHKAVMTSVSADLMRWAPLEGDEGPVRMWFYNPTGKVLAFLSLPALQWPGRNHDCEALRRMLVVKLHARRQGIGAERMAAYLAAQPGPLRNPYTAEPFDWNPATQAISFVPGTYKYWKDERLAVTYRAR